MKVDKIGTNVSQPILKVETEQGEKTAPEKVFHRTLSDMINEENDSFLQGKIDEITAQGEKLWEKADLAQLNKYKEMIRELINHTVSNGFKFSKSNQFDSRGRGKVYAIIKRIDKKLDEMTQKILENEKDNIDLMAQVNDIRGLLVDMFM